jgi:predicted Zn-dependent protease
LEEMIRTTKRGVLITRLWYTNLLEPRALLLTGLTRDGNFLIEDGRLTAPAGNMRFNQSLGRLFSSIEALSPTQRTWRAVGTGASAAPALLVKDFLFSSQSSGI